MSSRESIRLRYCSAMLAAHGEMKNERTAITSTSGPAKIITGRIHDASERPEFSQISISESRQLRVSSSSTVMKSVSESSTGSTESAEKPRNATTVSEGILPPAAWPRSRMRRVVTAMRNSDRNTAIARLANSRSSEREKIMRYLEARQHDDQF